MRTHHNLVAVDDGVNAMSDAQHRAIAEPLPDCSLDNQISPEYNRYSMIQYMQIIVNLKKLVL